MAENVFYARLDNSAEFRRIFEVVKDIVPLVNLNLSENGIFFNAYEALTVLQVKLHIPASYFSEYKCPFRTSIGISLTNFYLLTKVASHDDNLILTYAENSTVLSLSLQAKIPKISNFSLNLITVSHIDCIYVEVNECGKFEISSKLLHQSLSDLGQVSEFLSINLNKSRIKFSIISDLAGGSINMKHVKGDSNIQINTPKTFNSQINLMYTKRITKAHILSDRVEVKMFNDEPMVFCYFFNSIELKFYLAPAIFN